MNGCEARYRSRWVGSDHQRVSLFNAEAEAEGAGAPASLEEWSGFGEERFHQAIESHGNLPMRPFPFCSQIHPFPAVDRSGRHNSRITPQVVAAGASAEHA